MWTALAIIAGVVLVGFLGYIIGLISATVTLAKAIAEVEGAGYFHAEDKFRKVYDAFTDAAYKLKKRSYPELVAFEEALEKAGERHE